MLPVVAPYRRCIGAVAIIAIGVVGTGVAAIIIAAITAAAIGIAGGSTTVIAVRAAFASGDGGRTGTTGTNK